MRVRLLFFAALLASFLPFRGIAAQSAEDLRSAEEIRALFDAFNAAWERRDSAFIRRYYAHDTSGVFFFERRQLEGWPQVDTLYDNMFASAARGQVHSLYDVLDVRARGDVGWLAADFRLEVVEPSGETTVDEGRQSVVFERRDGRWVVVHRHTSFQAPPGPQRHVPLHTTPGPLWSAADDTTGGPHARAIRMAREASNAAIARHDTAAIGATMADDIWLVGSTGDRRSGREAYLTALAERFRAYPDVRYVRTPEDVRVFEPWGTAAEEGRWVGTWTDTEGPVRVSGTYFARWRLEDAGWRIEAETFVPDACSGGEVCRGIR
ncbi:MAG: nuclear transport factor 2 family protein [Gemmatimonadota bacterium]|jgi:uncharacterized protein (TIGR02246 family)